MREVYRALFCDALALQNNANLFRTLTGFRPVQCRKRYIVRRCHLGNSGLTYPQVMLFPSCCTTRYFLHGNSLELFSVDLFAKNILPIYPYWAPFPLPQGAWRSFRLFFRIYVFPLEQYAPSIARFSLRGLNLYILYYVRFESNRF